MSNRHVRMEFSMSKRDVFLNDLGQWLLYRAMVCNELEKENMLDMIDCDPWEYSSALDMSFEETKSLPVEKWASKIAKDCEELKNEIRK